MHMHNIDMQPAGRSVCGGLPAPSPSGQAGCVCTPNILGAHETPHIV